MLIVYNRKVTQWEEVSACLNWKHIFKLKACLPSKTIKCSTEMEPVTVCGSCYILKAQLSDPDRQPTQYWVQYKCEPPLQTLVELGESLELLETLQGEFGQDRSSDSSHPWTVCSPRQTVELWVIKTCMYHILHTVRREGTVAINNSLWDNTE